MKSIIKIAVLIAIFGNIVAAIYFLGTKPGASIGYMVADLILLWGFPVKQVGNPAAPKS